MHEYKDVKQHIDFYPKYCVATSISSFFRTLHYVLLLLDSILLTYDFESQGKMYEICARRSTTMQTLRIPNNGFISRKAGVEVTIIKNNK